MSSMPVISTAADPTATSAEPSALGAARGAEQGQYLIFTLGGEAFAIGILAVKEIIEYGSLTEVPMMPTVVRGVINLRGAVVPVIDLAARFGRGRTEVKRRTCIVIVELQHADERHDVGVIVDAVNEVIEIPPGEIQPAPSFGTRIRTEFVAGIGEVENKFVIILNIDHVLSLEDIGEASVERVGPHPA